jgi:hypothetical protein
VGASYWRWQSFQLPPSAPTLVAAQTAPSASNQSLNSQQLARNAAGLITCRRLGSMCPTFVTAQEEATHYVKRHLKDDFRCPFCKSATRVYLHCDSLLTHLRNYHKAYDKSISDNYVNSLIMQYLLPAPPVVSIPSCQATFS